MNGVTQMDVTENVALISLRKIPADLAVLEDIFGRFSEQSINIDMISQTAPVGDRVTIAFTCLDSDMVKVLEVSRLLSDKYPQIKPMVSSGNCKIRLYGEEMRSACGVFAKVVQSLAGTQTELQQISTSEVDISLLFPPSHLEEAESALREAFAL